MGKRIVDDHTSEQTWIKLIFEVKSDSFIIKAGSPLLLPPEFIKKFNIQMLGQRCQKKPKTKKA